MRARLGALLALLLAPTGAWAIRFPTPPQPGTFVVDEAGLLSPAQVAEVTNAASALMASERLPLYVVTVSSLASCEASGETIESFATKLFDTWGIGSQERNGGALLLVSVGDRKARIELGAEYGRTHDAAARDVMNTLIVPAFKRGDYATGIRDGVRGMDAMAKGLRLPRPTPPAWFWPVTGLGGVGVVALVVSLFRSGRSGWGWAVIAGVGALVLFALLRRKRGGNGLGGGSSGGGGATGSW